MTKPWRWGLIVGLIIFFAIVPLYRYYKNSPLVRLGLDLRGGVEVLLEVAPFEENKPLTNEDVAGVVGVLQNRLNPRGTSEVLLLRRGQNRIEIQYPGEQNVDRVLKLIGQTANLEFIYTRDKSLEEGTEVKPGEYHVVIRGDDLKSAGVGFDRLGRPAVSFNLKSDAARNFYTFTSQHIGEYLTIVLDGKVISSPVIKTDIPGGSGIIEGGQRGFSLQEATDLATLLNAGRLPAKIHIQSYSLVGPTLGKSSIEQSLRAAFLGLILVLLFMIFFYRAMGLLADIALTYYATFLFFLLVNFDVTLTIYGIAGLILSLGMAVDANILIFERIKEEIRSGKTIMASVESGHQGAFPAIFDSNVTTILAAAILYFLGTGTVKGFALTLTIGVLVSMFTALIVTRALLEGLLGITQKPALYGLSLES